MLTQVQQGYDRHSLAREGTSFSPVVLVAPSYQNSVRTLERHRGSCWATSKERCSFLPQTCTVYTLREHVRVESYRVDSQHKKEAWAYPSVSEQFFLSFTRFRWVCLLVFFPSDSIIKWYEGRIDYWTNWLYCARENDSCLVGISRTQFLVWVEHSKCVYLWHVTMVVLGKFPFASRHGSTKDIII